MNIRQGSFRIWVILSIIWVIIVGIFSYGRFMNPILSEAFVMKDTTSGFFKLDNYFDQFDPEFSNAHQVIEFPNQVKLFAAKDISVTELETKSKEFYEQYSKPRYKEVRVARLQISATALMWMFVPVLLILLMGIAVSWVVAGFRSKPSTTQTALGRKRK